MCLAPPVHPPGFGYLMDGVRPPGEAADVLEAPEAQAPYFHQVCQPAGVSGPGHFKRTEAWGSGRGAVRGPGASS